MENLRLIVSYFQDHQNSAAAVTLPRLEYRERLSDCLRGMSNANGSGLAMGLVAATAAATVSYLLLRAPARAASSQARKPALLLFGDSITQYSMNPELQVRRGPALRGAPRLREQPLDAARRPRPNTCPVCDHTCSWAHSCLGAFVGTLSWAHSCLGRCRVRSCVQLGAALARRTAAVRTRQGWGAALAHWYGRSADVINRGASDPPSHAPASFTPRPLTQAWRAKDDRVPVRAHRLQPDARLCASATLCTHRQQH